jgi:hypothetical protein
VPIPQWVAERFAMARTGDRRQPGRFAEWERQELRVTVQERLRAAFDPLPAQEHCTINQEMSPQERAAKWLQQNLNAFIHLDEESALADANCHKGKSARGERRWDRSRLPKP